MQPTFCPGPVSRRDFLSAGLLSLGGLTLPGLVSRRCAAAAPTKATSVIFLFLHGGASQLETFDLKPEAPSEIRSVFRAIPTNVPGIDICELFPRLARVADRFSLIRSLHHTMGSHSDGQIEVLTGKTPTRPDPTSTSKSEHPDLGMITSACRGAGGAGLPQYIALPRSPYATRPVYLGLSRQPFVVGDPSQAGFRPPVVAAGRDGNLLDDRRSLLTQLDGLRRDVDSGGVLTAMDTFRAQAVNLLTSRPVADAFRLEQEDPRLRDRYGRHLWGQGCLLARRLAQAGVGVVTLFIDTPKNGQEFTNWDDHAGNAQRPGHFAEYMRTRLPYLDESLAALIGDIYDRGLDREIMVVVTGEFGRTPRIRKGPPGESWGRDHWPDVYSALVAGGGTNRGIVVGASNSKSEYPKERPVTPQDLLATIYRHLGIDYGSSIDDFFGRPIPIVHGEPIAELLSA